MGLRIDFSYLRLHKSDHRFNCDSPTCTCGRGRESVGHFFLHCTASFMSIRGGCSARAYQKASEIIGSEVQVYPEQHSCCILLYGSESFNSVANKMILESTWLLLIRFLSKFLALSPQAITASSSIQVSLLLVVHCVCCHCKCYMLDNIS